MTSSFMKKLSWAYLIIGIIFSVASGFIYKKVDYSSLYNLEAKVNVALIFTCLGGVLFSAFLLFAVSQILEHTENTYNLLYRMSKEQHSVKPENSSNSKMNLSAIANKTTGSEWRCPECGKTNPTSSRTCKDCGHQK